LDNFKALLKAIAAARPSSVTGRFMRSLSISSSMGPGIKVAVDEAAFKGA
jgi:large subunit ribosomal protein L1